LLWVQAAHLAPAAHGPYGARLLLRPVYDLPFGKDVWGSMRPPGATASCSNDVGACDATGVASLVSKK